jgi:hypothetical protein
MQHGSSSFPNCLSAFHNDLPRLDLTSIANLYPGVGLLITSGRLKRPFGDLQSQRREQNAALSALECGARKRSLEALAVLLQRAQRLIRALEKDCPAVLNDPFSVCPIIEAISWSYLDVAESATAAPRQELGRNYHQVEFPYRFDSAHRGDRPERRGWRCRLHRSKSDTGRGCVERAGRDVVTDEGVVHASTACGDDNGGFGAPTRHFGNSTPWAELAYNGC